MSPTCSARIQPGSQRSRNRAGSLLCLLPLLVISAFGDLSPDNPKPLPEDFVLPMPEGASMVFRPVALGIGPQVYANRGVRLGDRSAGGFKEYPTTLYIGGSFLHPEEQPVDWIYYIGKYEVTRRQYDRIMNPENIREETEPANRVSWFDVQAFIHQYNLWLFKEAPDSLPKLDQFPGFLRLPSEAEWEFAARGGNEVSQADFDKRHPYGRRIGSHEWYSGPRSSHDQLKKIGMLAPNPLGLFDILGNVSEITASGYQVEYIQGRTGGYTARGGHFRTPENQLRSSLRTEQPFYRADGQPTAMAEMGFRLVIAAPVFAGRTLTNALSEEWDDYRKERPTPGTAQQSTDPTSARTTFSLDDAQQNLDNIEASLSRASSVPEDVSNSLGLLKASFGDVRALIYKAEKDSAAAWARMASFTAWYLRNEKLKIPASQRVLEISQGTGSSAEIAIYEQRHNNLLQNIRDAETQYGVIMEELGRLSPETVTSGFQAYEQYLIANGLVEQIRVNHLVIRQYEEFRDSKRLNMDAWTEALNTL